MNASRTQSILGDDKPGSLFSEEISNRNTAISKLQLAVGSVTPTMFAHHGGVPNDFESGRPQWDDDLAGA